MTQRHFVTRWLGAFGLTLALVGQLGRGTTSAQTTLAETRQSADRSDADAQYRLGLMYATGQGVAQDFAQAAAWYRKAADQGDAYALANLGNMYLSGQNVPQDYVEAHMWYSLAASRATGDTQKEYAAARDALAKQMPRARLAEAQRLARDWEAAFEQRQAD